jgi:diacylglycerol kinase (ATP)
MFVRYPCEICAQREDSHDVIRLWKAFLYSLAGLRAAWQEPAVRLEVWILVVAVPVALWLPVDAVRKLLLIGSVTSILVIEIVNSAIEAAIDRISYDRHPLSKAAKDLGSAAVFVASLLAAATWMTLVLPLLAPMLEH